MRRLLTMSAVAVCLLAAGCGGKQDAAKAPVATGAQSGAATLRAALTGLLEDHVYLSGTAISQGVRTGFASATSSAAAAALDANSVALATLLGDVYGAGPRAEFLTLWRKHVTLLIAYARGRLEKKQAAEQQALGALDTSRNQITGFLAKTDPRLKPSEVGADLKAYVEALSTAIDATVAKSPDAYAKLADAATQMPLTAKRLAVGIVAQNPGKFPGAADGGGAALRAGLAGLLTSGAHLTMLASDAAVRFGADAAAVQQSAVAADANAVAVSEVFSSVYGEDAGQQLLKLWRTQASLFAAYTKDKLAKDDTAATQALTGLDRFRDAVSALLTGLDPGLRKSALEASLRDYVDAATAAIRADVARSAKSFAREQDLSDRAGALATELARDISAQFPDTFAAE
jgi:hypothetical protein